MWQNTIKWCVFCTETVEYYKPSTRDARQRKCWWLWIKGGLLYILRCVLLFSILIDIMFNTFSLAFSFLSLTFLNNFVLYYGSTHVTSIIWVSILIAKKDETFMNPQAHIQTYQLPPCLLPQNCFSIHYFCSTSHIVNSWTSALPFPISTQGAPIWFVNVMQCQDAVKWSYVSSPLTAWRA